MSLMVFNDTLKQFSKSPIMATMLKIDHAKRALNHITNYKLLNQSQASPKNNHFSSANTKEKLARNELHLHQSSSQKI